MSCFPSAEEKENLAVSAAIEKTINEEREFLNNVQLVKILLMGTHALPITDK